MYVRSRENSTISLYIAITQIYQSIISLAWLAGLGLLCSEDWAVQALVLVSQSLVSTQS